MELDTLLAKDGRKGAIESVQVETISDGGVVFGLGERFMQKRLGVGISVKYVSRLQGRLQGNAVESSVTEKIQSDQLAKAGIGLGVNLGAIYKFGSRVRPMAFGLTIKNIGGMKFTPLNSETDNEATTETSNASKTNPLKSVSQNVNIGFAVMPGTRLSKAKLLFDYYDLLGLPKECLQTASHWFRTKRCRERRLHRRNQSRWCYYRVLYGWTFVPI